MKTTFLPSFFFAFLSLFSFIPRVVTAQSSASFNVDVSGSNFKALKVLALPGNKVASLHATPNHNNLYLRVYSASGSVITNADISTLFIWPASPKSSTEFNAIVTNSGNIFITYTASDADDKTTDNARFVIVNESGALQGAGQVNTTDPGNSLTRYIQLAKLSDGKIVVQFRRSDNYTYAFRIFNDNGTAFTDNDIVYAGTGTANNFGGYPVEYNQLAAFKNGNFMVSFSWFYSSLRGIIFDNNGNTVAGGFEIDPTTADEYNNKSLVSLPNGNMAVCWGIDNSSYFKTISSTGTTVQDILEMDGGRNLGTFIPDNTPGAEGVLALLKTAQDEGDFFGNPNFSYEIKKYDQSGVLQSTTPMEGDLILPVYYFTPGISGGYAYMYSYFRSYDVSDGEYSITSDNDIRGAMSFPMSTLPVTLVDYSAKLLADQRVQLNWNTSWESNSDYFEIEKSIDGINYIPVGRTEAAGNSTIKVSYTFIDPVTIRQRTLYRLSLTDMDGKTKSLGIRMVNLGAASVSASVYPNPAMNSIMINTGGEPLPAPYKLSDMQGRTIKTGMLMETQQILEIGNLPAGLYLLRIGSQPVIKIRK